MRIFILLCFCVMCTELRAQIVVPEPPPREFDIKLRLHRVYMPEFNVQEWAERDIRAWGFQISLSQLDDVPWEAGFHAYNGYGKATRMELGTGLSYAFLRGKNQYLKAGLEANRIFIEDIRAPFNAPGPAGSQLGQIDFDEWGTVFNPFIEWEWRILPISSLFARVGYRIINGDKSEVLSVEEIDDDEFGGYRVRREHSFFYALAGYHTNVGFSINF